MAQSIIKLDTSGQTQSNLFSDCYRLSHCAMPCLTLEAIMTNVVLNSLVNTELWCDYTSYCRTSQAR